MTDFKKVTRLESHDIIATDATENNEYLNEYWFIHALVSSVLAKDECDSGCYEGQCITEKCAYCLAEIWMKQFGNKC